MRTKSLCAALLFCATFSLQPIFAATVYTRDGAWDILTTTATDGSDQEALIAGNMWSYEAVDGSAADANYGGANEWWNKPADAASSAFTWNSTNNRLDGPLNSTNPKINSNNIVGSDGATAYGWQPRALWKAPAAGTVTVSGDFGMQDAHGSTLEWVIGKRSGGVYTALANGSVVAALATPTPKNDISGIAALQNITMAAGDQIFWTHRPTAIVSTASNNTMWDGSTNNGRLTFTFTPDSRVSDWAAE